MPLKNETNKHVSYLRCGYADNVVVAQSADRASRPSVRIYEDRTYKKLNMASSKRKRKMARAQQRFADRHPRMENDKIILHPRNPRQKLYLDYLSTKDITFATGFPGTSKTLLALYHGFKLLDAREIDKIYIAKPKVGVRGEKDLGALPGTLEEKTQPYLTAIEDCLNVFMTPGRIQHIMSARGKDDSQLEFLPFDFLRGRTLHRAFIIIDEAQNVTTETMFTILSRIGEGSKIVVTGDTIQRDLNVKYGKSGLEDAIMRLSDLEEVGIVQFLLDDVCRSPLAKKIIGKYQDLYGYGK